jgi:hypothetical protein
VDLLSKDEKDESGEKLTAIGKIRYLTIFATVPSNDRLG